MGLLRISRELSHRVCNHGEPRASSHRAREEHFYRGEKEVGQATGNKESSGFSLAEPLPAKESVFFLLGSAIVTGHESSPF